MRGEHQSSASTPARAAASRNAVGRVPHIVSPSPPLRPATSNEWRPPSITFRRCRPSEKEAFAREAAAKKTYCISTREMRNLHRKARDNALTIFQDNENLKLEIENNKRELISRAKQLEKLSVENANDRIKLAELADEKQKDRSFEIDISVFSLVCPEEA